MDEVLSPVEAEMDECLFADMMQLPSSLTTTGKNTPREETSPRYQKRNSDVNSDRLSSSEHFSSEGKDIYVEL